MWEPSVYIQRNRCSDSEMTQTPDFLRRRLQFLSLGIRTFAHRMVAHRAIAHKMFGHRMTAHRAAAHKPFAHRMFAHKTIAPRTLARCEFCIDTGNQRKAAADGLARTTNIVEGWHHSLQVILQCSHPTLWKLLSQLMNDCSKQKASLLQGSTGIEQ